MIVNNLRTDGRQVCFGVRVFFRVTLPGVKPHQKFDARRLGLLQAPPCPVPRICVGGLLWLWPPAHQFTRRGWPSIETARQAHRMNSTGRPLLPSRLAVKKETAAKLLECSIDTVDRLIARGHLPSVRLGSGRAIRIPLPALEEFIQNQTTTIAKGTQDK